MTVKRFFARTPRGIALQTSKCIVFSCALVAAARSFPADAGSIDTEMAIAHLLETSATYWNQGQLDRFMTSYENSPSTTYVSSKSIIHGYDAIREHYASTYRGGHTGTLSFSDLSTRPLGQDFAVVVARWHLAMHDKSHPSGIFSLVLHRSGSGWHIITDHSP